MDDDDEYASVRERIAEARQKRKILDFEANFWDCNFKRYLKRVVAKIEKNASHL